MLIVVSFTPQGQGGYTNLGSTAEVLMERLNTARKRARDVWELSEELPSCSTYDIMTHMPHETKDFS